MNEKMVLALNILKGINKDECVELNHAELTEVLKHFGKEVTVHPVSTDIKEIVTEIRSHYPEVSDVTDEVIVREISKYAHVIEKPTTVYFVTPDSVEARIKDDTYEEYYKWRIGYIMFNGKPLFLYVSDYDLFAQRSFHVDRPYVHVEPVCTCIVNGDFIYIAEGQDHWIDLVEPGVFKIVHVGKYSYVVYDEADLTYVTIDGVEYIRYALFAK